MQKKYKVIVAHPGKQHSFQLAEALKKEDMLYKYMTTVYAKEKSLTKFVSEKLLDGNNLKKAEGRKCLKLDDKDVLQFNEFYGLMTLFLSRIKFLNKFYLHWIGWVASNFYKKVMKYAKKHDVDAVIVYDGYSNKHFELLNDSKIISIMDVSIATRHYMKTIFEKEIVDYNLPEIKTSHYEFWNKSMMQTDMKGFQEGNYFLAPSEFVKESLYYCGIIDEQIKKVPYGVDITKFNFKIKKKKEKVLRLIYVGHVSYRKGLHHLLKAITMLDNVHLTICGGYNSNSRLYIEYKNYKNIDFLGFVTGDKLSKQYQEADVFILPSLGEGMALVGLEALACGLPLICTENTGVNDLVVNYENGIVIPVSSLEALKEAILWFTNNIDQIDNMKKNARNTALKYSWESYHKNVVKAIKEILSEDQGE